MERKESNQTNKTITFPAEWTLLNVVGGGEPWCFNCLLCILTLGESGKPMSPPGLQLTR